MSITDEINKGMTEHNKMLSRYFQKGAKKALRITLPTTTPTLKFRRFREGATMPTRSTPHSAGIDLYAWCYVSHTHGDQTRLFPQSIIIHPKDSVTVLTGINARIPAGYELQARPRSGLAFKYKVTLVNSPGTIDADYDGDGEEYELKVGLINHGTETVLIHHGDRIAQLILAPVIYPIIEEVFGDNTERLESTRNGGFGSTGK